jgi:drug/metabolite transporter (DMT)-like permease
MAADAPLPGSHYSRLSPNVQGALWMLAAAVTFVGMTTLVKYLGPGYPPSLQNFYRQTAGLFVVLPFVIRNPRKALYTDRPIGMFMRALAGTVGTILQFYSYQHMTMAEANALSFTRPLWVVPLAAFMLREQVGMVRIAAVLAGFGGMIIMLQPWSSQMQLGLPQMAALGSAVCLAFSATGLKSLTRTNRPITVLAWAMIFGFITTLPPALMDWRWPSPADFGLLAVMGVCGALNNGFFIKAMSVGDAIAMAPLDYTRLVLSVASGLLLFGEVPKAMTLLGALVIVVSTLYITWREQQLVRRTRADAALQIALEEAPLS